MSDNSYYITSFILGFAGSLHCAGMCGPLALSLPVGQLSFSGKLWAIFRYNLGRAITYSVFGIFAGLVGSSFRIFGWQQVVSILSGLLVLIFYFKPFKQLSLLKVNIFQGKINSGIQKIISYKKYFLLFGLLNGLLPCGLVYMALAASASGNNIEQSILFMFIFGFGTFPLMISIPLLGHSVIELFRGNFRKVIPVFVVSLAAVLILRGLGLGIPYLSPKLNLDSSTHRSADIHCSPNN